MSISGRASVERRIQETAPPSAARRIVTAAAWASKPSSCASTRAVSLKRAEARRRELLHRHALLEILQRQAAIGLCIAIGGQSVIRSAAIVPHGDGRPAAEEHRSRRLYARQPRARLGDREQQVLGRVVVRHSESRLQGLDHEQAHVSQRLRQDGSARQRLHLPLHLAGDLLGERRRRSDQKGLRVGAVFGLGEQVGGDEIGARAAHPR